MKVIINIPNRESITLAELCNLLDDEGERIYNKTGINLELIDNTQITLEEQK